MKTFIQWAEDKKLDLPVLVDEPASKKTVDEKTNRGGIAHWAYPDYPRKSYPKQHFMPTAADAAVKLGK